MDLFCSEVMGVIMYEDMFHFSSPAGNNEIFEKMKNLKIVSTVSAGFDHLDVEYLKSRNIRIGHTPKQVADATADQAMSLLLAGARNLYRGATAMLANEQAAGESVSRDVNDFGQHFTGATLGIVRMGNIGIEIAKRAHYGFQVT